jgi:hypothetical protein
MKRYDEYSKAELAEVSTETLNTLIDLELAHEGVLPVVPPTPLPEFSAGIKPTETLYEVFGILFAKQEDAITTEQDITISMLSTTAAMLLLRRFCTRSLTSWKLSRS